MSSTKLLTQYAVRGVIESSYAAGGVPVAADGILPMEIPEVELEHIHDGTRGRAPLGGQMTRVAQSGLGASLNLVSHMYTPGVAYSVTEFPSLDRLLRICGMGLTTDFTGGSESYIYRPVMAVTALESLFMEVFNRGQQFDLRGVYGNFQVAADGPSIPVWTFELQGIGLTPTADVVTPTDTVYVHTDDQKPQKAVSIGFNIGTYVEAVVRSYEFNLQRELTSRADDNSAGHAGFSPGDRDPRLTVVIEADNLGVLGAGTINPYQLKEDGTEFALSLLHGVSGAPGQYKRWKLDMAQAQIVGVTEADDGPTAAWELEIMPGVTVSNQDDFVLTLD